jgi:hypothetical protein
MMFEHSAGIFLICCLLGSSKRFWLVRGGFSCRIWWHDYSRGQFLQKHFYNRPNFLSTWKRFEQSR